ncbi:MAG TPA: NIPSNAP family protein [Steroidobacteraceae bacterium]|nr:NIPSNAP family protein [Steroidobacteraceae bacterium]
MSHKSGRRWIVPLGFLAAGVLIGNSLQFMRDAHAATNPRVFEIRTYTTNEGKLDALQARFRDHVLALFKKHDMTSVGYWLPQDPPLAGNTLIYILSHTSREAAKKHWDEFRNDPEVKSVMAASEANGKIVAKVESVFATATDFSPIN